MKKLLSLLSLLAIPALHASVETGDDLLIHDTVVIEESAEITSHDVQEEEIKVEVLEVIMEEEAGCATLEDFRATLSPEEQEVFDAAINELTQEVMSDFSLIVRDIEADIIQQLSLKFNEIIAEHDVLLRARKAVPADQFVLTTYAYFPIA